MGIFSVGNVAFGVNDGVAKSFLLFYIFLELVLHRCPFWTFWIYGNDLRDKLKGPIIGNCHGFPRSAHVWIWIWIYCAVLRAGLFLLALHFLKPSLRPTSHHPGSLGPAARPSVRSVWILILWEWCRQIRLCNMPHITICLRAPSVQITCLGYLGIWHLLKQNVLINLDKYK